MSQFEPPASRDRCADRLGWQGTAYAVWGRRGKGRVAEVGEHPNRGTRQCHSQSRFLTARTISGTNSQTVIATPGISAKRTSNGRVTSSGLIPSESTSHRWAVKRLPRPIMMSGDTLQFASALTLLRNRISIAVYRAMRGAKDPAPPVGFSLVDCINGIAYTKITAIPNILYSHFATTPRQSISSSF